MSNKFVTVDCQIPKQESFFTRSFIKQTSFTYLHHLKSISASSGSWRSSVQEGGNSDDSVQRWGELVDRQEQPRPDRLHTRTLCRQGEQDCNYMLLCYISTFLFLTICLDSWLWRYFTFSRHLLTDLCEAEPSVASKPNLKLFLEPGLLSRMELCCSA